MVLVFVTIICGFGANILYLWVLQHNDSYVVTAVAFTSPIFTLILAYFILNERVTPISVVGVFMIVIGVYCISMNNRYDELIQ